MPVFFRKDVEGAVLLLTLSALNKTAGELFFKNECLYVFFSALTFQPETRRHVFLKNEYEAVSGCSIITIRTNG